MHYPERSPETLKKITETFNSLKSKTYTHWGYHDGENHLPETALMKGRNISSTYQIEKIIIKGWNEGQKTFNFLDIGAGSFQWGKRIFNHFNKENFLPDDMTINIYSIRAEKSSELEQRGKTLNHFPMGQSNAEVLDEIEAFKNKEFDLIVSSWCFRHLVDPVGTLLRAIDKLKPGGLLATDAFFMSFGEYIEYTIETIDNINLLLQSINVTFFRYGMTQVRGSLPRLVIKKTGKEKVPKSLNYASSQHQKDLDCYSEHIQKFTISDNDKTWAEEDEIKTSSAPVYTTSELGKDFFMEYIDPKELILFTRNQSDRKPHEAMARLLDLDPNIGNTLYENREDEKFLKQLAHTPSLVKKLLEPLRFIWIKPLLDNQKMLVVLKAVMKHMTSEAKEELNKVIHHTIEAAKNRSRLRYTEILTHPSNFQFKIKEQREELVKLKQELKQYKQGVQDHIDQYRSKKSNSAIETKNSIDALTQQYDTTQEKIGSIT